MIEDLVGVWIYTKPGKGTVGKMEIIALASSLKADLNRQSKKSRDITQAILADYLSPSSSQAAQIDAALGKASTREPQRLKIRNVRVNIVLVEPGDTFSSFFDITLTPENCR